MNSTKTRVVISQLIAIIQLTIGGFFLLLAFLYIFWASEKYTSDYYWAIFFFAAIGSPTFYCGLKRRKLIKNFKTYVKKLSVDPTGSISDLASKERTSVDVVKKNLEMMISKKFFINAYIDVPSNCIIFPASNNNFNARPTQSNVQHNTNQPEVEYFTVTCKSCGGINKIIKGKVSECDFCGSPIKEA